MEHVDFVLVCAFPDNRDGLHKVLSASSLRNLRVIYVFIVVIRNILIVVGDMISSRAFLRLVRNPFGVVDKRGPLLKTKNFVDCCQLVLICEDRFLVKDLSLFKLVEIANVVFLHR